MTEHRPSSYKISDLEQTVIGRELFEWWWRVGTMQTNDPEWDECLDHIQAFWMDGAWTVMNARAGKAGKTLKEEDDGTEESPCP